MAQVAFNIRMDEDLKRDFGQFCSEIGMSMSTAFVVFARKALSERRIPFVLDSPRKPDPEVGRRAMEELEKFRAERIALGRPEMSMDEINEEIALARRERRERREREAREAAMESERKVATA